MERMTGAAYPGFLTIDSPQKDLGHGAARDSLIADAVRIDDFYRFLRRWLKNRGDKAQVIVADNSWPDLVAEDVIVCFGRYGEQPQMVSLAMRLGKPELCRSARQQPRSGQHGECSCWPCNQAPHRAGWHRGAGRRR